MKFGVVADSKTPALIDRIRALSLTYAYPLCVGTSILPFHYDPLHDV